MPFFDKSEYRHILKSATTCILMVFFGLLWAMPLAAQTQQPSPFVFKLEGGGIHQSETDLGDTTGGFAVDRWFASASLDYGWSLRDSIGASVGAGQSSYEFNDLSGFGGGNPWAKIDTARVSLTWRSGFGKTGSFFLMPTARVDGEKGTSSSDSTTYGVYAAAAWWINETLTIGPGIGIFSRLEDNAWIFPILVIDWDITDHWNLSTGRGLAASQGPGLTLGYQLNEDWTLGISGRYEDIEFRLDNDGPQAGGVGRDQSLPLVFLATLTPDPQLKLSIFAGIELGGTLELKNAAGEIVAESNYDPAPILGASFEVRF